MLRNCLICLILLLALWAKQTVGANFTLISPPKSVNVTLATERVVMSCTAKADLIIFLVDGGNSDFAAYFDQGSVRINDNATLSRNLTAQVSPQINNTEVTCLAIFFQGNKSDQLSKPAIIRVQGPLDPPGNPVYTIINQSTIHISWTPPPTLLGTVINGYNISISSGEYVFINDNHVTLTMNEPDPCTEINVTISAYNRLDGEIATINGIYLPASFSQNSSFTTFYSPLLQLNDGISKVQLNLNVSRLCPGEIPTYISVLVDDQLFHFSLLPSCDETLRVSNSTVELIENHEYCLTITYGNDFEEYGVTSTISIRRMFIMKTFRFLVFLIVLNLVDLNPTIVDSPSSVNVTVANHSFTMVCTAQYTDNLLFIINQTNANEGVEGFSEDVLVIKGNNKTRILTVTVSLSITNTNISCRAFNFINNVAEVLSKLALILVQGALDPPTVTNTTIINATAVSISWEAPPTLEGTVINGYYISSTSGDSLYTEDTSITLPITDPDPCGVNISIIPYNGINGTAAEVDGIIIPSIPSESFPVSIVIDQLQAGVQEIVNLIVLLNVSTLCPGEYPGSVLIDITNSTESTVFSDVLDLAPSSGSIFKANISIKLIADQLYNITVIPRNVLGDYGRSELTTLLLLMTPEPSSIVVSPTLTIIVASFVPITSIVINVTEGGNKLVSDGTIAGIVCGIVLILVLVLVLAVVAFFLRPKKLETGYTLESSRVIFQQQKKLDKSEYNSSSPPQQITTITYEEINEQTDIKIMTDNTLESSVTFRRRKELMSNFYNVSSPVAATNEVITTTTSYEENSQQSDTEMVTATTYLEENSQQSDTEMVAAPSNQFGATLEDSNDVGDDSIQTNQPDNFSELSSESSLSSPSQSNDEETQLLPMQRTLKKKSKTYPNKKHEKLKTGIPQESMGYHPIDPMQEKTNAPLYSHLVVNKTNQTLPSTTINSSEAKTSGKQYPQTFHFFKKEVPPHNAYETQPVYETKGTS